MCDVYILNKLIQNTTKKKHLSNYTLRNTIRKSINKIYNITYEKKLHKRNIKNTQNCGKIQIIYNIQVHIRVYNNEKYTQITANIYIYT